MTKLGIALACGLCGTLAHAEPEGYQGGEGRPAGTTYAPPQGPSLTVRGVSIATTVADAKWTCGGAAQSPGTYALVTVTLELSNPTNDPVSGHLDNFDLVIGKDKERVVEGTCTRGESADVPLAAKKRRTVREQFLIPRGETPQLLVYNNDDFPTLFALPRAKRAPAKRR